MECLIRIAILSRVRQGCPDPEGGRLSDQVCQGGWHGGVRTSGEDARHWISDSVLLQERGVDQICR